MPTLTNGIFAFFRNASITSDIDSFVNVTSSDSNYYFNWDNGCTFCDRKICGGPPKVVIDGNLSTAWANKNETYTTDIFLQFEFYKDITVSAVAIQLMCNAPKFILFQAYNNHEERWVNLTEKSGEMVNYNIYNMSISNPSKYRLFRLKQIGSNTANQFRFHVHKIEFYGMIDNKYIPITYRMVAFRFFPIPLIFLTKQ